MTPNSVRFSVTLLATTGEDNQRSETMKVTNNMGEKENRTILNINSF